MLLVDERGRVLVGRRHLELPFMGGFEAFPGGAIEPDAEPVRLGREEAPAKTAGQVQARAPHDVERYI
mgnify:CR=1 FL=1